MAVHRLPVCQDEVWSTCAEMTREGFERGAKVVQDPARYQTLQTHPDRIGVPVAEDAVARVEVPQSIHGLVITGEPQDVGERQEVAPGWQIGGGEKDGASSGVNSHSHKLLIEIIEDLVAKITLDSHCDPVMLQATAVPAVDRVPRDLQGKAGW